MNGSQIDISLKNAGVYRDNKWLIRGIDLSVRKGEIGSKTGSLLFLPKKSLFPLISALLNVCGELNISVYE